MRILFVTWMLLSFSSFAAPSLPELRTWLQSENIQTMEEFLEKLPTELKQNFTLMHDSKSLHGSDYANPRAILFNKKADWIVTFNGHESQAAGRMVEMMLYDQTTKKYAFHEIEFADKVTVHESPTKCLACHGSEPRPIWDHYNQWPGAYGADDDRFNAEEYEHLQKFIQVAPTHPRYKYLERLSESYKPSHTGMRGGLTERAMRQPNRFLTMKLYEQRIFDLAESMREHPEFQTVKPLVYYFLTKCYLSETNNSYGDGSNIDPEKILPTILKNLLAEKKPNYPGSFNPEHSLDYIFSRLGMNTHDWYLNSRDLATYRVMKNGTDRTNETWLNLLLTGEESYQKLYNFGTIDFEAIRPVLATAKNKKVACDQLAQESIESIKTLENRPPLPPAPGPSERGMEEAVICRGFMNRECRTVYKTLPQICFKCHTQNNQDYSRLYLPFHLFPEMSESGDTRVMEKMYNYINSYTMPRRVTGDERAFNQYIKNDYPRLKKYLESLLKRTP